MTYPPQGPYGQQPDPYGQQQQPQYGGGYQQQPGGQYGGYDPNAQYGGGYQQYGGLGGPPQPPKSKKGPVIAVVAIVVLLLAGLGITGFVAPGFFLSDDKDNNAGSGGDPSSTKPTESGASGSGEFIDDLVAAADAQDAGELKKLACSGATDTVDKAIDAIDNTDNAELGEVTEESADEVQFILTISFDGKQEDDTVTVRKDGDEWCWHDIESGTPTGGDDSTADDPTAETADPSGPDDANPNPEGEQFVQTFLDALNSGDGAGAAAMSCSDSTSQADITKAAGQKPQLVVDEEDKTGNETYVGVNLKGTLDGEPATGRTSAFVEDGKWCIYTFFAS